MSDQSKKIRPQSSRREIADQLNRAFDSSDLAAICQAIGDVIRLHNVTAVAKLAGIKRTSLYRAFGGRQSPNLSTVLAVMKAMGFKLKVTQLQPKRTKLSKSSRR
jgi:probable addiction module antidote protein